jgi:hypothetical protein
MYSTFTNQGATIREEWFNVQKDIAKYANLQQTETYFDQIDMHKDILLIY